MPYAPHQRLTLSGLFDTSYNFGEVVEQWSVRLNFTEVVGDPGPAGDQAILDDMAADCAAWIASPGAFISASASLVEVKAARIGADGLYVGDARLSEVTAQGGGGALKYPPQVAYCLSLDTGERGGSKRGRAYSPLPTVTIGGNTGRVTSADRNSVASAFAGLLDTLNDRPGLDPEVHGRVCIASSKGFNTIVTSVRCGDVLDTIRSRRNQMPEAYSAPLVVSG